MVIKLLSFSKKRNSTKVPASDAAGLSLTGTLKDPCSVLNPVVRVKRLAPDAVPWGYSYAYIAKFNRYYFVDDIRWVEPFWEISMSVDVLGSHKTAIGASTHYVLRTDPTTSQETNPWICDTMYPATSYFTKEQSLFPNYPFSAVYTGGVAAGTYILGIISGETTSNSVGAISYYAMTAAQFATLKGILFGNANLVAMGLAEFDTSHPGQLIPLVTDMSLEMTKAMYNPYQYIASCIWFPFSVNDITEKTLISGIEIGWWRYPCSGYQVDPQLIIFGQHMTPPSHPMAATRGYYLNYAPYTRRTILGVIGETPVDCSYIGANDALSLSWSVDIITGQCRVDIGVYDNSAQTATVHRIMQRECLLGVPIQLAQIATDYLGTAITAVDSAAKTTGNMLSLNFAGAVSSAAHGIYDTLSAAMPQMQTSGSNGSLLVMNNGIALLSEFFIPVDEDITHKGRPLCANKVINTLSGFILCADGDFDISCLAEERSMISDFLTSGFFWE